MRTKFIALLLCLCPLLLIAQDYKKEGDELFQQAQYTKAIKKYNAYIAFAGEDPAVSKRIADAQKCNSLLSRAKSAEQAAAESSNAEKYEEANRLYSELYSLHSLPSYKSKVTQLQKKADAIRIERERKEAEERKRIARERQRADSIRREQSRDMLPNETIDEYVERLQKINDRELREQLEIRNNNRTNTTTRSKTYQSREEERSKIQETRKQSNHEIDILDMNNTTPFNIIKWKVEYSSNAYDAWFSEKSGLITDSRGWTSGMSEGMGWYALHRFNRKQYTCNYLHSTNSLGRDGYGDNLGVKKAVRDCERNTLPIENGYYVLDLRDWDGYKPLYLPYSQEYLKSKWQRGMIKFEYR